MQSRVPRLCIVTTEPVIAVLDCSPLLPQQSPNPLLPVRNATLRLVGTQALRYSLSDPACDVDLQVSLGKVMGLEGPPIDSYGLYRVSLASAGPCAPACLPWGGLPHAEPTNGRPSSELPSLPFRYVTLSSCDLSDLAGPHPVRRGLPLHDQRARGGDGDQGPHGSRGQIR